MAVKLTIDGKKITAEKGQTVLECALKNGITIPHLCTHPHLEPFGACRMCVVEIEGMRGYPTSCTTPATEGMVVHSDTQALQALRRNILGLMMLEHPSACLICDKRELCEQYRPHAEKAGRTTGCHTCNNKDVCEVRALSAQLGFSELPVQPNYRNRPLDRSNPFIDRDLNLCILCGRCVRICQHQQGFAVIDFVERGSKAHIGQAFGRSLAEADCRFCGSCVDVCPTGTLADRYAKWHGKPETLTKSSCIFCDAVCALEMGASNGKLIAAQAVNKDIPICVLGRFAIPEFLNGPDRLRVPYVRVGKVLRETQWEQALATAAGKLKEFIGPSFALVCDSTSLLEDRYIFQKFTREVMNSPHYLEIAPDERGVSVLHKLPDGVRAVLLTGCFIDPSALEGLDLVIAQDIYPSAVSERADIVFPAAVFAEVQGTIRDGTGANRPLIRACAAQGQAREEWQIISQLAQAMEANDFAYLSVEDITGELGITEPVIGIERTEAPAAATDIRRRSTHFRGHRIDERVRALRGLPLPEGVALPVAPVAMALPTQGGFTILEKREIAPNVHEVVIEAPHIAKKALPGQFVIVMADETSERVPFTLCDWDEQKGTITLVILEVGQSSRKIALANAGDKLAHVAGPLGIPLEIKHYGTVALAGGCYGIGAILRIAAAMKQAGNHVIGITEARSHYNHYYKDKLEGVCDELIQTTSDGSLNIKGHAVDVIGRMLKGQQKIDMVVAVGCPFMMMLCARETQPSGVKTLVALNPIMLDGTGMCGACRVTVGGVTKFACVDGPFFDGHLVDWDELWDRRAAYSNEEIDLVSRTESVSSHSGQHNCRCNS
ncbi:MAG: sulfide/dihydroorotate dehydrogenase-like FAD/NAD-binding protein [Dehalococcoidia bacterium]